MVMVEGLDRYLVEHAVFSGLNAEHLELVRGCSANVAVHAGEYIYREGQAADKFYLIRHGAVSLEVYVPGFRPIVLETLHANDLLGWSWLLPPYRSSFDCRATELTRLISVDAVCLRGKMEEDPVLGYTLYKRFAPVIAERLSSARRQLIDLYGHPDPTRPE